MASERDGGETMAGVLDLDAVVVETTEVKKTIGGKLRTWTLRDDVPPEIMLACFRMLSHAEIQTQQIAALQEQTSKGAGDVEQIEAALASVEEQVLAQQDEVTHICGDIFRHSYPETTDAEIKAWFRADERTNIVQLFFTRRLAQSSTPLSDTTETPTPNRAERRASSKKSSGAIPSQKRLSRELRGA